MSFALQNSWSSCLRILPSPGKSCAFLPWSSALSARRMTRSWSHVASRTSNSQLAPSTCRPPTRMLEIAGRREALGVGAFE
eukprot:8741561-Pyramimonas_sp.AAC.1